MLFLQKMLFALLLICVVSAQRVRKYFSHSLGCCVFFQICANPASFRGQVLCFPAGQFCGECVSFYKVCISCRFLILTGSFQVCTGDSRTTSQWRAGARVRGTNLAFGTGIATFPNGRYSGHVAIYTGQDTNGIQVWDQVSFNRRLSRTWFFCFFSG